MGETEFPAESADSPYQVDYEFTKDDLRLFLESTRNRERDWQMNPDGPLPVPDMIWRYKLHLFLFNDGSSRGGTSDSYHGQHRTQHRQVPFSTGVWHQLKTTLVPVYTD